MAKFYVYFTTPCEVSMRYHEISRSGAVKSSVGVEEDEFYKPSGAP